MFFLGFLVVHDTVRSGQNDVTELTRWEEVGSPFIDLSENIITPGIRLYPQLDEIIRTFGSSDGSAKTTM